MGDFGAILGLNGQIGVKMGKLGVKESIFWAKMKKFGLKSTLWGQFWGKNGRFRGKRVNVGVKENFVVKMDNFGANSGIKWTNRGQNG